MNEWLLSRELCLKIIPWTSTVRDPCGSQVFFHILGLRSLLNFDDWPKWYILINSSVGTIGYSNLWRIQSTDFTSLPPTYGKKLENPKDQVL